MSWVKTLPRGTLDQWAAFDAVEPIGEQWLQTAKIVTAIEKLVHIKYMQAGVDAKAPSQNDAMPSRYQRPKVKKPKAKPADSANAFGRIAAAFGFKKVADNGNNNQSG
jgi:hypothetical protein